MKLLFKNRAPVFAKLTALVHDTAMLSSKAHAVVFSIAVFASSKASAATGVTGFFTGWKSAMTALISLVLLAGMAVGIMAALYGIINMIKKGMGRGDDIEWGKITWPIIGGALATILLYVIQAVVEEGGATRGDMGRAN